MEHCSRKLSLYIDGDVCGACCFRMRIRSRIARRRSSRHADRLREPDSTTMWYLQIGPEVEKIR